MANTNDSDIPPVPFLNLEFLQSPAARAIRILSEYIEHSDRFRRAGIRDTIVFYGSARSLSPEQATLELEQVNSQIAQAGGTVSAELEALKSRAEVGIRLARYYNDAMELARRLTEWSHSLTGNRDFVICSGGAGGMMEAANRGASMAGGKTVALKDNIIVPTRTKGSGRKINATVDLAGLEGDPSQWGFQVVVQSNEGFPAGNDLLTRKVNEYEGQHRFGGGNDNDCDPHAIDVLAGEGKGDASEVKAQHDMLSYECAEDGTAKKPATLTMVGGTAKAAPAPAPAPEQK